MKLPSTEQLARASARRPWMVIGIWVVLLLAGGFLASSISDVLTSEFNFTTKPDSAKADDLLEQRLRGPKQAHEQVIVRSDSASVDDAPFRAGAERLIGELRSLDGTVANVTSYYETSAPDLVSSDRHTL